MPALRKDQFWKGDPNQMSFPGLEEHGHPGARLLTQGYRFRSEGWHEEGGPSGQALYAIGPTGQKEAELHWMTDPLSRGEIGWVEAHPPGRGIPGALYGIGRTMARVKPQHSSNRSYEGDLWAKKVSKIYGGRIPKQE